tara:strand:+ start:204 stop:881 length:678 start_codon:yes stop_codon:yes gene_type:complete
MKRSIIITGSEGLLGKEISKYFRKFAKVHELDLSLGHDLTDEKFVKEWFSKNHADYLINCFAVNDNINKKRKKTTLFNFSLDSFQDYLNVNLISLFSVCREFAKNNKKSSIINFSSIYGTVSPNPSLYDKSHKDIGYSVSKAGVIHMTKYLAVHLAPKIRVNCIVPGGVLQNQDLMFKKKYSKLTPMNRMMKKNELNGILDFLCSKKSSYMTGSIIFMDGGYTAW